MPEPDVDGLASPFVAAGKAVFHVEPETSPVGEVCELSRSLGLSTIFKTEALGPELTRCP